MAADTDTELESWKNPTAGRVWVNRLDHRGDLKKTELVGSGKTFHLSAAERRANQEMAYNTDLDVFANGTLTPVRLVGSAEEAAAFAANPNHMTEDDMRSLVNKPKGKASELFTERLGSIRNAATLERLLALAREEDAPLSRVEAIQTRLTEVNPTAFTQHVTTTATPASPEAAAGPSAARRQGNTRGVTPR